MRDALDSLVMTGFVAQLDRVNAAADRAAGFVWRLQTPDGNSIGIRADSDPHVIVNMSVWESIDALRSYVYTGEHLAPLRARKEWVEELGVRASFSGEFPWEQSRA
jgi:hypothetical protein